MVLVVNWEGWMCREGGRGGINRALMAACLEGSSDLVISSVKESVVKRTYTYTDLPTYPQLPPLEDTVHHWTTRANCYRYQYRRQLLFLLLLLYIRHHTHIHNHAHAHNAVSHRTPRLRPLPRQLRFGACIRANTHASVPDAMARHVW